MIFWNTLILFGQLAVFFFVSAPFLAWISCTLSRKAYPPLSRPVPPGVVTYPLLHLPSALAYGRETGKSRAISPLDLAEEEDESEEQQEGRVGWTSVRKRVQAHKDRQALERKAGRQAREMWPLGFVPYFTRSCNAHTYTNANPAAFFQCRFSFCDDCWINTKITRCLIFPHIFLFLLRVMLRSECIASSGCALVGIVEAKSNKLYQEYRKGSSGYVGHGRQ